MLTTKLVLFASVVAACLSLIPGAKAYDFTPEAHTDLITELPGLKHFGRRRMYSGYIPVEGEGRELFYWLIESEKGFAHSPVMLWTNGGPGCSGLIGLMTENGPFRPNKHGKLEENKFAWTKLTSMVYIEQPVGVGFSKGGKFETYNDAKAARDNYRFIVNFFVRYPELRTNEFYISSESYGGHYMPTLAKELVDRGGIPNFKGFFVGNPLTSGKLRDIAEFMAFNGHNVIPRPLFEQYHKNKCFEDTYSLVCQHLAGEARRITSGLDPYGLDFPVCTKKAEKLALLRKLGLMKRDSEELVFTPRGANLLPLKAFESDAKEPATVVEEEDMPEAEQDSDENEDITIAEQRRRLQYFPSHYEPCEENYATSYLNHPDVKKALHVRPGTSNWAACNDYINIAYNQTDVALDMVPYYKYLATKPIKIWIFSGDDDSVCATWQEQKWTWSQFSASSQWSPWHFQGQVAGYNVHFKGFTFATVHGAGHFVPAARPAEALELLKRFLRA